MQLAEKAGRKAGAQKCRCKQLLWKGIKKKMHGIDNKQGEYPVRARACGLYAHPKLFTGSKPVSIALGSGEKQKLGKAAWRPLGSWIDRGRLVLCGFGADLWGGSAGVGFGEEFLFAQISQLVQETAKCGGANYYGPSVEGLGAEWFGKFRRKNAGITQQRKCRGVKGAKNLICSCEGDYFVGAINIPVSWFGVYLEARR